MHIFDTCISFSFLPSIPIVQDYLMLQRERERGCWLTLHSRSRLGFLSLTSVFHRSIKHNAQKTIFLHFYSFPVLPFKLVTCQRKPNLHTITSFTLELKLHGLAHRDSPIKVCKYMYALALKFLIEFSYMHTCSSFYVKMTSF